MKCALTGANGFLGSHLTDRLLADGHEVTALVRQSADLRWLSGTAARLVTGSLDDPGSLAEAFAGAELIFHCAGVTQAAEPGGYYRANVEGTRAVARAAMSASDALQRFVLVSTLAVHGDGERDSSPVSEKTPCEPVNHYGKSKLAGEEAARALAPRLPLTVVRPGGIYGARDTMGLPLYKQAARGIYIKMGLGRRMVNMCHVADIVEGLMLAATSPAALGETFLLGDADNYTMEAMGRTVVQAVKGSDGIPLWMPLSGAYLVGAVGGAVARLRGKRPMLNLDQVRMYAVPNWAMDVGKARRLLAYRPCYTLLEGATETAAWYREAGWL